MFIDEGGFVNPVNYDGAYLRKSGSLTGVSDSGIGILSFWIRVNTTGTNSILLARVDDASSFTISLTTTAAGKIQLSFQTTSLSAACGYETDFDEFTSATGWHHVLIVWNAGTPTFTCYIDDAADSGVTSPSQPLTVPYVASDLYYFGAETVAGGPNADINIADFYLAPGQTIDISVEANRRKFIDANDKPVFLGFTGDTPTGTAPRIFLRTAAAGYGANAGTGGNFTATGTFTNASSSPI